VEVEDEAVCEVVIASGTAGAVDVEVWSIAMAVVDAI
jgi:hypothetical protein